MNVNIKELSNNPDEIKKVQIFLFDMIKKEFGYDYVPEWHQDIVNMGDYYINPERNAFFIAYSQNGEIIGTIGIRAYERILKISDIYILGKKHQVFGDFLLIKGIGVVVWLQKCMRLLKNLQ